ncbi:MAG: shikimate kinase [Pseudomonadota bacterium]
MNIFLIGYRCSGKTSVGRSLATRLGWPFIDTDSELVGEHGASISDIVQEQGWEAFREMERAVIKRVSALDGYVVATGGGAVLESGNVEQMKTSGVLVWLRANPPTIEKRMLKDQNTGDFRPALTAKGLILEVEETLEYRHSFYENAANFFIDTDEIRIDKICGDLLEKLTDSFPIRS